MSQWDVVRFDLLQLVTMLKIVWKHLSGEPTQSREADEMCRLFSFTLASQPCFFGEVCLFFCSCFCNMELLESLLL